jgi:3-hydroxybutyryl-CoA dehydrogenase
MVRKIGVVGSGIMGAGISQIVAEAGFEVLLYDISEEALNKAVSGFAKWFGKAVSKGKITQKEADNTLKRITVTSAIEDLKCVECVIEAVSERMELKKKIFSELDGICDSTTVFMTNTSGLSVSEIASVCQRKDQFVGLHFFNPVPMMKLVEVIKGYDTNSDTFNYAMSLAKEIGKEPIEVRESPLFIVNRILVPMINEAINVLELNIGSKEDIDKGMALGANHPIGPLKLADMIGLDTLLSVMDTLYEETQDSKYRSSVLLRKMVRAGHLGVKSGQGFYDYE